VAVKTGVVEEAAEDLGAVKTATEVVAAEAEAADGAEVVAVVAEGLQANRNACPNRSMVARSI
jgi:hypothetical protein